MTDTKDGVAADSAPQDTTEKTKTPRKTAKSADAPKSKTAPRPRKSAASKDGEAASAKEPAPAAEKKTSRPAKTAKAAAGESGQTGTEQASEQTAKQAPKKAAAPKGTTAGTKRATSSRTSAAKEGGAEKTPDQAPERTSAQAPDKPAPKQSARKAPAKAAAKSAAPAPSSRRGAPAVETTIALEDNASAQSVPESVSDPNAGQATDRATAPKEQGARPAGSGQRGRGGKNAARPQQPKASTADATGETTDDVRAATPETQEQQGQEQESRQQNGEARQNGRSRSRSSRGSRGRGGAKRAASDVQSTQALQDNEKTSGTHASREEAGEEREDASGQEAGALSDFPSGFDDSGPEEYFASLDDTDDDSDGDAPESGERKRRSRSRRGRGRKKSAEAGTDAAALSDGAPSDDAQDEDDDLSDDQEQTAKGQKISRRKMFVSVLPEEQIEVVITEEGQVQEYYVEMLHQAKTKGNIYKGIVHNVDPNLQAAFVSYGAVKNGFLQIDEVHPEYYVAPHEAAKGRKYPLIQKVLRPGQEVLVQIVKEPAGTKGAFLTTYLSMPGRFLVLTPGREQIGVSRKVDNESERARLRELLEGLTPGPGLGVIVRTVSMGASKTNLQKDLQQLKRVWKDVRTRGTEDKAPCLIYQEMDLTSRAVRDYLTDAITEVWIDDEPTATAVSEIATMLFPRKNNLVKVHQDTAMTLFERFNVQRQLDQIHSREVVLPSGGRLVIDPTEALTAIDINSGRSGGKNNFEDMAYRTNMEAARMIPLQLRLRDIGGQVVADFIEMRDKSHWREVEKTLRNGMKVDRARYDVGKIGPFGLLEIVRQRLGSSAISVSTEPCPCCNGTGMRRNMEWQSQTAMRDILRLIRAAQAQKESSVAYVTEQTLALHLLNNKRQRLQEMEQTYGVKLLIQIKQPDPQ